MGEVICKGCNEKKEHHAKGMCYKCYRKLNWEPPKGICKRCNRELTIHSRGLCNGCYNSVFHIETVKAYNRRKRFDIDNDQYKELTQKCVICGFDKITDLHHLDHNKKNNSPTNLVGLCPNHHRLLHNRNFQVEIFEQLKEKGFSVPEGFKKDELFK